ncbi:MAG: hypothetical protein ABIH59_03570 [archaeon]
MKKKDNIIHIRLESEEAVESKKDVLNTEVSLIKIAQAIRKYKILRLKELELKIYLYKKIKEFKSDERKLKTLLPKLQIPKILKKHEEEMHNEEILEKAEKIIVKRSRKTKGKKTKKQKKVKPKQEKPTDTLDFQLKEIQDKLNKLE